ncbi:MAG: DUF4230 domain-containing protein [Ruminococcaceae bacterium]|nr:DUF4230 domain-containing protein [Oscillospiraceae bacterium]
MPTNVIERPAVKSPVQKGSAAKKLLTLSVLFMVILVSIFVLRGRPKEESEYVDRVADQIGQEMEDNRIVLSSRGVRRTAAEFREPILLTHGKESRLIVHTARLSETISIASEGLGGWAWTSAYQDVQYTGEAQYTVDLSLLSDEDFVVHNELKTLTVRIPYAELAPIHIPADQIKFRDVKKGWAAPGDIKMTAEDSAQLMMQVSDKMKAKLIDENVMAAANEDAKRVVKDLLSATVHSIDPEFTVVVVQ